MNDYVEIVCFFIDVFYMKEWLSWTIRQAEINLSLNTRYKQTQRAKIYLANRKKIFKPFFFTSIQAKSKIHRIQWSLAITLI